jgi:glycosyltransferase involved in cell wall biosynthesis
MAEPPRIPDASRAGEHVLSDQRPVRVCFVIENLLPAGTELWVARLIQQLDRSRVQPLLCLTDGSTELSQQFQSPGCPVLRLGLNTLKSPALGRSLWQLARFLRQHQVDVVQVHHADPTYLAVPVARWVGVGSIVQTKYDVGYWMVGNDLRLHRWLRRWVDVTVANCQACRAAAIAQERAPAEQVVVIENGICADRLAAIPELTLGDLKGRVRIGMVANLRPVKDPHNLIEAASRLARDFPQLEFHLAGQGELFASLVQRIEQLQLGARCILHGHVADTSAFWSCMALGVLCSRSEGLPHALLEAMAAGRAVVATRVGGNTELIADRVTGRLVPAADPASLAAAIRSMLEDPELTLLMASQARQHVLTRFDEVRMVRRFEAFYGSLRRRLSRSKPWRSRAARPLVPAACESTC